MKALEWRLTGGAVECRRGGPSVRKAVLDAYAILVRDEDGEGALAEALRVNPLAGLRVRYPSHELVVIPGRRWRVVLLGHRAQLSPAADETGTCGPLSGT